MGNIAAARRSGRPEAGLVALCARRWGRGRCCSVSPPVKAATLCQAAAKTVFLGVGGRSRSGVGRRTRPNLGARGERPRPRGPWSPVPSLKLRPWLRDIPPLLSWLSGPLGPELRTPAARPKTALRPLAYCRLPCPRSWAAGRGTQWLGCQGRSELRSRRPGVCGPGSLEQIWTLARGGHGVWAAPSSSLVDPLQHLLPKPGTPPPRTHDSSTD